MHAFFSSHCSTVACVRGAQKCEVCKGPLPPMHLKGLGFVKWDGDVATIEGADPPPALPTLPTAILPTTAAPALPAANKRAVTARERSRSPPLRETTAITPGPLTADRKRAPSSTEANKATPPVARPFPDPPGGGAHQTYPHGGRPALNGNASLTMRKERRAADARATERAEGERKAAAAAEVVHAEEERLRSEADAKAAAEAKAAAKRGGPAEKARGGRSVSPPAKPTGAKPGGGIDATVTAAPPADAKAAAGGGMPPGRGTTPGGSSRSTTPGRDSRSTTPGRTTPGRDTTAAAAAVTTAAANDLGIRLKDVLRHKAQAEGLAISADGWMKVKEALKYVNKSENKCVHTTTCLCA